MHSDKIAADLFEEIKEILGQFAFEENHEETREGIVECIEAVFREQPEEIEKLLSSYFVQCDTKNNPRRIVAKDKLLVDVRFTVRNQLYSRRFVVR